MRYLVSLILIFASLQLSEAQVFEGGFFGGFVASQVDGDTYGGYNKFGISLGGFISKEHLQNTNWKFEIRYIQKGSAQRETEFNPTFYKLTIHYVEIPLIYQYEFYEDLIAEIGLSPDVYLFHKEEDEVGDMDQDDRPDYHRFGLNGDIGLSYKLNENVIVGLRRSHSIFSMRDHASGQSYYLNTGQRNNVFHFTIYYQFR